ncbi:MAG: hypothetical protein SGJ18_05260 [Pseudomonadota bacterium]|nr:hypothetical protein [Pseudomonadota bacterium]
MLSKLLKVSLFGIFCLNVSLVYAQSDVEISSQLNANKEGGDGGGGGDRYVEVFFKVATTAIDNLKLHTEFAKISEQVENLYLSPPVISLVDTLIDCKGNEIKEAGQYAQACKGRIQLIKNLWSGWLSNEYTALPQVDRIFHEVLRVTSFAKSAVTNDEGYITTHKVLRVTDLITNPNCERVHETEFSGSGWLTNKSEWYTLSMAPYSDIGAQNFMDRCKMGIFLGAEMDLYIESLNKCQKTATKFAFFRKPKDDVVYKWQGLDTMKFLLSRKCVHDEKALSN